MLHFRIDLEQQHITTYNRGGTAHARISELVNDVDLGDVQLSLTLSTDESEKVPQSVHLSRQ